MSVEQLITDNIDIWTSAIKAKSASGRGSSTKPELYGIKKLRELILELAVRGKLVPQDSNDEPASTLLGRIAAEKEQLIKDKKIKKQKPLPPISDEEKPFELPDKWEWCRLGEVGHTNIGLTYKPSNVGESGTPVLRSSNIQNRKIDLKDLVRVQGLQISASSMVEENDLLICARNGSKALVGKTAKITQLDEPMAFGAFMAIYRSPINSYVEVYLNSPIYRARLEGTSTTTINQITQNNLKLTECPVPPLGEQKRIVAKVDELIALCDQLELQTEASTEAHQTLVKTLLETLTNAKDADELSESWQRISEYFDVLFTTEDSIDQLKQTILQLAVMGKLVKQAPNDEPASKLLERIAAEKEQLIKDKKIKKQKSLPPISDEEKPFDVPAGWEWCRVQDIAYVFAGNSFKSQDFRKGNGARVIKITNAGVNELIETDDCLPYEFLRTYPNYIVNEGDLIIALTRPYISNGLKVSECPKSYHNSLLNQRVAAIRVLIKSGFTFKFLQSQFVLSLYQKRFGGSGLQPNLKMNDITELLIPIPPIHEQKCIVAKVEALMTLCDTLEGRLKDAQTTQLQLTDAIVEQVS